MRVKHAVMHPMMAEGQMVMHRDMPGMPGDMQVQMTRQPDHIKKATIAGRKKHRGKMLGTSEMKP